MYSVTSDDEGHFIMSSLTLRSPTVLDPDTGAGAYKISGGANGGDLLIAAIGLFAVVGIAFVGSIAGWFALPFVAFIALSIGLYLLVLALIEGLDGTDWKTFLGQAALITGIFLGVLARALAIIVGGQQLAR